MKNRWIIALFGFILCNKIVLFAVIDYIRFRGNLAEKLFALNGYILCKKIVIAKVFSVNGGLFSVMNLVVYLALYLFSVWRI